MQDLLCPSASTHRSLSFILFDQYDIAMTRQALAAAEPILRQSSRDYEILVIGDEILSNEIESAPGDPPVRFVVGKAGLRGALQAARRECLGSLIVVTNGVGACSGLAELLAQADDTSLLWKNVSVPTSSFWQRLQSRGWNFLVRDIWGADLADAAGQNFLALIPRSMIDDLLLESRVFQAPDRGSAGRQEDIAIAEAETAQPLAISPVRRWPWGRGFSALIGSISYWWSSDLFPGQAPAVSTRKTWILGLLFLMAFSSFMLFFDLNQPLLDPDEGRQAEVPREMMAHDDMLTPRMLGQPYYEKPPLQYWFTVLGYSAFGVRPYVARIAPALAAWIALIISYFWARIMFGNRAAFIGGMVLCLSFGFIMLGRTVILDSLLSVWVVASWLAGHLAVRQGPNLRWRWWLISALACGLGILTKGPVALVLLIPPVFLYQILTAQAVKPRWRDWLAYGGLALGLASPWYILMAVHEPDYLATFLGKNNIERFLAPFDHERPWWFYFPVLFTATFPWSMLWAWMAYFLFQRSRRSALLRTPALGFCVLAIGWCFFFYSCSGCKSPPYLAPVLAPLALLVGAILDALLFRLAGPRIWFFDAIPHVWPRRATLIVLVISFGCYSLAYHLGWETWYWTLVKMLGTIAAGGAWWCYRLRARASVAWMACALVTAVLIVVAGRDLVEGYATRHSLDGIAKAARRWPGGENYPVVMYLRQWPSACFYLRRELIMFIPQPDHQRLLTYFNQVPGALVLVEKGQPLDDLMSALPDTFDKAVTLPDRPGQAALVVIHRRGG